MELYPKENTIERFTKEGTDFIWVPEYPSDIPTKSDQGAQDVPSTILDIEFLSDRDDED